MNGGSEEYDVFPTFIGAFIYVLAGGNENLRRYGLSQYMGTNPSSCCACQAGGHYPRSQVTTNASIADGVGADVPPTIGNGEAVDDVSSLGKSHYPVS